LTLLGARSKPVLAISFAAAIYLLALTATTRFGLSLGMDQLTDAAGVVQSGVSYGADVPAELQTAAPIASAGATDPSRVMHYSPLVASARFPLIRPQADGSISVLIGKSSGSKHPHKQRSDH
jgi:hypothetical protein